MDTLQDLDITTFPVMPLGCNCSIIKSRSTGETIVVDPGGEGPKIVELLKEMGCKVKAIIHTHAHFDHVLGTHDVAEFSRQSINTETEQDVRIALHPGDNFLYKNLDKQCLLFGYPAQEAKSSINHALEDEEEFKLGESTLKVLHTPGHTPGSCCFSIENSGLLFSGDTLFAGSIGRTDLMGGDHGLIIKSIKSRLLPLDDGTKVIPGHGTQTSIYNEKTANLYL